MATRTSRQEVSYWNQLFKDWSRESQTSALLQDARYAAANIQAKNQQLTQCLQTESLIQQEINEVKQRVLRGQRVTQTQFKTAEVHCSTGGLNSRTNKSSAWWSINHGYAHCI